MPGGHDSRSCSFCERGEEETGPLFSRGPGRICAWCVAAAAHALDREGEPGERPAGALEQQVERHRRLTDRLLTLARDRPGGVPARVMEALEKVVVSSRSLEATIRRWGDEDVETGSDPPARFAHVASKLVAVLAPLRAWRASLPHSVPQAHLYAVDQAIIALATLAKILDDPGPEGTGRKR